MNRVYRVAGHRFMVQGDVLCDMTGSIAGFAPFEVKEQEGDVLFSFASGETPPHITEVQYEFTYEDVKGTFGRADDGYILILKPCEEQALYMWTPDGEDTVYMCGNMSVRLFRFAMWVGFGLMTLPYDTVGIHSSCIVYKDYAVLFLGESGTGKSTHTRLWRENIEGSNLLNDDSPFIRVENGKVWAYGSPWSGKTPCYKQERYELKACVRLSQAPFNKIKKLPVLQAYGAIHPSCPPEFAYDGKLYDHIGGFVDKLLRGVDFYHLSCLPDRDAAILSHNTIFDE
ncbi:MAG: hypothetical protein II285_04265 [Flavobacteriales bacterium]|nr:hypothetical protein [Flavobacteriales bacterium]